MIKRNKKGFTIVELVIVIAIVAILAAILIPTFSSVIDRANESADIQTVRQINVIIAAELIEKGDLSLEQVLELLEDYNFTADNLKPAGDNHKFMWDSEKNMIILVEKEGETATLIYPIEDGDETDISDKINSTIKEIGSSTGVGIADKDVLIAALQGTGGEFKLTSSLTLDSAVTVENNVTLDLNGNTLTVKALNITNSGELNVSGGEESAVLVNCEGEYGIQNEGTLNVSGSTTVTIAGSFDYGIYNKGDLTLKNKSTTIETSNENTICLMNYGTADISNINAVASGVGTTCINNGSTLTLADSELSATGKNSSGFFNNWADEATISNVKITVSGDTASGVHNCTTTLELTTAIITVEGPKAKGIINEVDLGFFTASLTAQKVEITVTGDNASGISNTNVDNGTLQTTLNNSTLVVGGTGAYGIYNYNGKCTVDISNTDVTVTGSGAFGVHNGEIAETVTTINRGTFIANGGNTIDSLVFVEGGTLKITYTIISASAQGYENNAPIVMQEISGRDAVVELVDVTITSNKLCLFASGSGGIIKTNKEEDFKCGDGYNIFACDYEPCAHNVCTHYKVSE